MSLQRGGKLFYSQADKAEADKFTANEFGERLLTALLDDTKEYVEPKQLRVFGGYGEPIILTVMKPENLNKIINHFVKDNYRK